MLFLLLQIERNVQTYRCPILSAVGKDRSIYYWNNCSLYFNKTKQKDDHEKGKV